MSCLDDMPTLGVNRLELLDFSTHIGRSSIEGLLRVCFYSRVLIMTALRFRGRKCNIWAMGYRVVLILHEHSHIAKLASTIRTRSHLTVSFAALWYNK